MPRKAISAVVMNDKQELLLVKKKNTRILPWWKPEIWEDDTTCLKREIGEEIQGVKNIQNMMYYKDFSWKTPHTWDILTAKIYFADVVWDILEPSAEINAIKYFPLSSKYRENISDITQKVIVSLLEEFPTQLF